MIDTLAVPVVHELEASTNYGKFEVEPLEPGFGTTLALAAARPALVVARCRVTSVAIDGVSHEFSAIPHIKEDVIEILLNLKELCVVSHSSTPVRCTLDVRGARTVTGADIECPSDVEIKNPDLHICTLDGPKAQLRMDLMVEQGKGYVTAERNKKEGQPIGSSRWTPSSPRSIRPISRSRRPASARRPSGTS